MSKWQYYNRLLTRDFPSLILQLAKALSDFHKGRLSSLDLIPHLQRIVTPCQVGH